MYLGVDAVDDVLRLSYIGIGNQQMVWLRDGVSDKDDEQTRDM